MKINYHRDEDDTYWNIRFEEIVAYKVTSEEFSTSGNAFGCFNRKNIGALGINITKHEL